MESLKKIDFRLGTIISVKPNPKAKNPSFIVDIDFGGVIGKKTTSAQLPANYTQQQLLPSKQVVCVVNFPTKRIAGFKSEVLVVGFPDENSKVILLNPRDIKFPNGTQIHYFSSLQNTGSSTTTDQQLETEDSSSANNASSASGSSVLQEATYEEFEAAGITVGTIKHIEQEVNSSEALFTVDFGETIGDKSFVVKNLSSDVTYQLSSQLPVSINEQTNEIIPLGITQDNGNILLGVDRQVPNGGKLF